MRSRRPTRAEHRAIVLYAGLCVSLNYRADRPWSGLVGGALAVVVLAVFLMIARTLAQLAAIRRERDD